MYLLVLMLPYTNAKVLTPLKVINPKHDTKFEVTQYTQVATLRHLCCRCTTNWQSTYLLL